MTECVHCNEPANKKESLVIAANSCRSMKFIHKRCYEELWKSFIIAAQKAIGRKEAA